MELIILLLSLVALISQAQAASYSDVDINEWKNFKLKFDQVYESEIEDGYRMKIFLNNKRKIDEHNKLFEQGKVPFQLGVNQFAAMFDREYVKWLNDQAVVFQNVTNEAVSFSKATNHSTNFSTGTYPYAIDWRRLGAVTRVKNQGTTCASSWAFSATGALEGIHYRITGNLTSLSEQNLMDCSYNYGNYGCRGGTMTAAFQYIRDNKGIDTENSYPYTGMEYHVCRFNTRYVGATLRGFYSLREADENALLAAVASQGPVSVAIDASLPSFQYYRGGLYKDLNCGPHNLNHAVLVVGYNSTVNKEPYWLVKNSWGTQWGENGYIRMARNFNLCGIANRAVYPIA